MFGQETVTASPHEMPDFQATQVSSGLQLQTENKNYDHKPRAFTRSPYHILESRRITLRAAWLA